MGRRALPPAGLYAKRLDEAVEAWLNRWRAAARPVGSSTPTTKAVVVNVMVEILGGAKEVWTLTPDDFHQVFNAVQNGASPEEAARRQAEGRQPRKGRTTSGSLSAARTTLRQFAEYCHDMQWLPQHVTLKKEQFRVNLPTTRENASGRKYTRIPESEWGNILDLAERIHPRCRIAVALGVYGGRRVSEIVGLQVRDIDVVGEEIYFYDKKKKGWFKIPLFPQIQEELNWWKLWITASYGIPQPDWYIVPNRVPVLELEGLTTMSRLRQEPWRWPLDMKTPSRTETIQHDIRKLFNVLGLPSGENTHTFRRSSSKIVSKKFGLCAAQAFLHHDNIVTTQRYTGNEEGFEILREALMSGDAFPKNKPGAPTNNILPLR